MKLFTKFFVNFLCIASCSFILGVLFDRFAEFPMSMKANLMLSVIISLLVAGFITYYDRKKQ